MGFNLQRWVELQEQILTGELGWEHHRGHGNISEESMRQGPEMMHVGSRYGVDSFPKIVFLGISTNYKEGEIMEGTPAWIETLGNFNMNRTPNGVLMEALNQQENLRIMPEYEQAIRGVNFVAGEGRGTNGNYTLPLVVEEAYGFFNHQFPQNNQLEHSVATIAMMNLFPFQGSSQAGNLPGTSREWTPYGHVVEAMDILKPNIVFVFHNEAWNHLIQHQNAYGLTSIPGFDLAYRRDEQELWMSIYHFIHTAGFHPMEDFIEHGGAQFREFYRGN